MRGGAPSREWCVCDTFLHAPRIVRAENVFWLRRRVFHPFCPYCYQISGVTLTPPPLAGKSTRLFFWPSSPLSGRLSLSGNRREIFQSKYLMKTSFGRLFRVFCGDSISWPWKSGLSTPRRCGDFQWVGTVSILVFGPVISASDQSANQNVTSTSLTRTKKHLLDLDSKYMKYAFQGCFWC